MAAVGGSITEITYNHPTLGQGSLFPKSDADSTYDLGGYRMDGDGIVDGSGSLITSLIGKPWSFEVDISMDMNSRKELERITALAGDPVEADWTFTSVNGTVYGGKGRIMGDVQGKGKDASMTLKVGGGGILKQI